TPRDPAATAQLLAREILARAPSGAVVILDGAEDMDPGSRDVIDRLVRLSDAGRSKIKLLLATRTGSDTDAAHWIEERAAGGRFARLGLRPFGALEVGALCRSLFGADVLPESDIALLARASDGAPLALQSMILSLLQSGGLAASAGGFR